MPTRNKPARSSTRVRGCSPFIITSPPTLIIQGQSNGVHKNGESAASRTIRSRNELSVPTQLANSSITQGPQQPADPPRQSDERLQTKARKRKSVDEGNQRKKRLLGSSSAPARAAVSQDSVGAVQAELRHSHKKRRRITKHELPNKRIKPSATPPLSVQNLEKLRESLETSKGMEPAGTPADRLRKRAPSRQNSFSDFNDAASTRSQRSTGSLKFYRYDVLARYGMYIQHGYPPADIKDLVKVIFEREIAQERKLEICRIAQETADIFSDNTCGGNREDDFLETLYDAFCKMFPAEKFKCPRKADWNPSLKPDMLEEDVLDLEALVRLGDSTDDLGDRPSKRQQASRSFPSSSTPQSASATLVTPAQTKQDSAIKTPRPDCTIGHRHSTYTDALKKLGLTGGKADIFLTSLQRQQTLLSDPTVDYVNVRFPIQTIETKAYATGKTIFEAENQAAVSGACMVNQQQQLIDLHDKLYPGSEKSNTPFAFSVCTEGPLLGFWVHYARMEDGVRKHYMKTLYSCDGALADQLETFLVKWEQLMSWYEDEFLAETACRLYHIAKYILR